MVFTPGLDFLQSAMTFQRAQASSTASLLQLFFLRCSILTDREIVGAILDFKTSFEKLAQDGSSNFVQLSSDHEQVLAKSVICNLAFRYMQ